MGLFRFFFYPIVRAKEQMGESRKGIGEAIAALKKNSAKLAAQGAAVNPTAEFERLYAENEWTPEEFAQQLVAVRRTKFFAIGTTVASFFLVLYFLTSVPLWVAFFVLPVALFSIALGLVMVLKYTLFQEQLRRRALVSAKEVLSEKDFFKAVFK